MVTSVTTADRSAIVRRGLRLEYFTLAWNSLEALVAVSAGLIAGSIALVGFGIDSIIECSSGAVLVWRLRTDSEIHRRERVEQVALKLVGISFLLLAGYVAYEALSTLLKRDMPEHSVPGVVLAAASLVVMPLLARAKRRVAQGLKSGALQADSRQTDLCAYLSAILLGGLLLNVTLGWWWADPVSGLIMTPIIAREGFDALRGKHCFCQAMVGAQDCCGDECQEQK